MYVIEQIVAGLLVAHAFWLVFYLTGTCIIGRVDPSVSAGRGTLHVVLCSTVGLAVWGFEMFALGMLGALSPFALLLPALLNLVLATIVQRERTLQWVFWRERLRPIRMVFQGPALLVYAFLLVLCTHAAIPDYSSDGVRYHLAYPYAWFSAGRIFADHHFRFPYYALNYELVYLLAFVAHVGRYIPFINWLTGLLSCLGVYALVVVMGEWYRLSRDSLKPWMLHIVGLACAFALALSPTFLRWTDSAMTDTATGVLYFCAATGVVLAFRERRVCYLIASIVAMGFLAGTKPSFLFFLPFLACALTLAGRLLRLPRLSVLALIAALFVLASPWYVYNLIADGDPIPPFLNLAVRGKDPDFTRSDIASITADLRQDHSTPALITYPYRQFWDPIGGGFREYGVTGVYLMLYPVALGFLALMLTRRRAQVEECAALLFASVLVGIAYLFATSTIGRYDLLVYPVVCSSAGLMAIYLAGRFKKVASALAAATVLFLIPSPGTTPFYNDFDDVGYNGLSQIMPSDGAALDRQIAGYKEASALFLPGWPITAKYDNLLLVLVDVQYYAEIHGWHPFGEWTGSGRFHDFAIAIDDGNAVAYLDAHGAGALVVRRKGFLVPEELDSLHKQLLEGGFKILPASDASFTVYKRVSVSKGSE